MGRNARAALAAAILVLGAGAVIAQSDPIAARMALMKGNNDNATMVVQMMKGQAPFDAAKVAQYVAGVPQTSLTGTWKFVPASRNYPSVSSDLTGEDYMGEHTIDLTDVDVAEKNERAIKVVAENRDKAKASLDGLRAAIPTVGNACDNCHKDYRLSKQ